MTENPEDFCSPVTISEEDILAAMRDIQGYIDISPGDFKEIFQVAYRHAVERIFVSRRAADIMTRDVHCLHMTMDLRQAATFLADHRVSGAPVVDGRGLIVGVVSEKDFLARMGVGQAASFMEIIAHCLNNKGCVATVLRNHGISDIMSSPPITAGQEMTSGAISALFIDRRINRLPIVDSDGHPVGIVTRTDLVNSYRHSR
jgi:CBS domain-containing membrane protein